MNFDLNLTHAIDLYFQGEKAEALVFILPIGLLSLVFGAWLLTDQPSSFTKGVAIPFLALGLLVGTVGAVVGYRTPGQVQALHRALQASPAPSLATEIQRMDTVNKAWHLYLSAWLVLGFAGLLLRLFSGSDVWQGVGIALVFFAGLGMLIDGFAQRRALSYHATLQAQALAAPQSP